MSAYSIPEIWPESEGQEAEFDKQIESEFLFDDTNATLVPPAGLSWRPPSLLTMLLSGQHLEP